MRLIPNGLRGSNNPNGCITLTGKAKSSILIVLSAMRGIQQIEIVLADTSRYQIR